MASVRNLRLGSIAVAVGLLALLAAGAALAAPRIAGPQAEITSGPPDELFIRPGGTTEATWEFTANQPGARFTCKFTGFKVHPCHSPFTVSGRNLLYRRVPVQDTLAPDGLGGWFGEGRLAGHTFCRFRLVR